MSTKFFTNQDKDTSLLKKFEGVFANNVQNIRHFDALVGYFRASGYFKVRKTIDQIPEAKIRILIGINVDQLIKKYNERGRLYLESTDKTIAQFQKETVQNIEEADYDEVTEKGIIQFLDDLTSGKIELRAHPTKKLHAKVYIFRPAVFNEYAPCEVITGSSNLTDAGLGANPESNYEFNVSLRDYEDVKFASEEFARLWAESVTILQAEATELRKKTYLNEDITPFQLYMKMLLEYFGKRVDYDPYKIDMLLPEKFMRLKYQSDAANQGYAIMMKHDGFILADVVGLGKTVIACMVIKKFIYENGIQSKVLVVVPPAVEGNWRRTAEDFQIKANFEFITLGSLQKITNKRDYSFPNADEFDMVVVDESHKFRNDYTDMYQLLQEICKSGRKHASENGDSRKKVMLISATPLNNRPEDIEHQLYLFQDKRNSTLENVPNLQAYFKPINKAYNDSAKELKKEMSIEERHQIIQRLKDIFQKLRNDIIEPLVIRRTRTDIERNEDYREDVKKQGIIFPKVEDPQPIHYQLDKKLSQLFSETVSLITGLDKLGNPVNGLGYYRYRAIEYLAKEEDRKLYAKGTTVESISDRLSAIMKTLLVKRLESSFYAFKQSIKRFQKAMDNMLQMFEQSTVFIAPGLDVNKLLEEGKTYEEIEQIINSKTEGNNRIFQAGDFKPEFLSHLQEDKEKVDHLVKEWNAVKDDPKLDKFQKEIEQHFFLPKINPTKKLVV